MAIYFPVLSVLFMKDFDRHCAIAIREIPLNGVSGGATNHSTLVERLGAKQFQMENGSAISEFRPIGRANPVLASRHSAMRLPSISMAAIGPW
jgi:hypothetical protein